jgi:hypothetical protein
MRSSRSARFAFLFALAVGAVVDRASASEMNVAVELPRLDVAEYHRPYVAIWIEREDQSFVANLAVWYEEKKGRGPDGASGRGGQAGGSDAGGGAGGGNARGDGLSGPAAGSVAGGGGEGGTKWLNELRTWWRKNGREQPSFPIDGVTGPTKPAGIQQLKFAGDKAPLASLASGKYRVVVEAARENAGREVVRVPFEWPAKNAQSQSNKGTTELGTVAVNVSP